ncbi:tyrosine-protein phosphatase [Microbulbifer sp. SA54]|uniref:tyrosine-protein phosphatase n=1 Tax=Microbulbifer sp. SA54 TaxID=3401577 RepID=UPI003AAFB817
MIDLHSHIIPKIDDGPKDRDQSLEILKAAVDDGITHIVATPHIHPGRYPNTLNSITSAFGSFLEFLKTSEIEIQLALAAEVRITDELVDLALQEELPMLGFWYGDPVVLLEMPHSHIPPGVDQLLGWLTKRNIRPMVAHPERNKDIIRDIGNIDVLVKTGCLFQVTAGALTGQFGIPAQMRGEQLLKRGLVTVLASDTHHAIRRPPNLSAGRIAAEALIGETAAWKLVLDNPAEIVKDRFFASCSLKAG